MEFGVSTWLWASPTTTEVVEEMAPRVAEMGFDLIEIPLDEPELVDYEEVARLVREQGLNLSVCAAMGPERDLIHPEEETRVCGMDYVRECVDAAVAMGSAKVVGPLYSAVGRCWQSTDAQRAREEELLVEQLSVLADYASDRGVTLGVEPLNRFETSFINLTSQAVEIVDRVDSPSCQIILDIFHLGIEEKDLRRAIEAAGDRLCHVHAAENDRGIPGTGHLPWKDIASGLENIGYEGPLVIESFSTENETIAKAASIWRPLAPSPDAFAREGLAFLHELME